MSDLSDADKSALARYVTPEWPMEKLQFLLLALRQGASAPSTRVIGLRIGVTKNAVAGKCRRMRTLGSLTAKPPPLPRIVYSPEIIAYMTREYPAGTALPVMAKEISRMLGVPRTTSQVSGRCADLGLRRPARCCASKPKRADVESSVALKSFERSVAPRWPNDCDRMRLVPPGTYPARRFSMLGGRCV